MSVSVRYVVGELVLGEGHARSVHPLFTCCWGIRVHVRSAWQLGVCFSCDHPRAVVKLVPENIFVSKLEKKKKYTVVFTTYKIIKH